MAGVAAAVATTAKAAIATTELGTKPHGKRNNCAQSATRRSSMIPRIVSPSRQTRPNAPRDGAPNAETDRDRGLKIMTQHYENGLVKINLSILTPVHNYWTPLASQA